MTAINPFAQAHGTTTTKKRRVAIIVSHGGLDEVYPAFILANAARMSDIEAMIFFTFWGLAAITEDKVDHLHVNMAGTATSPRRASAKSRSSSKGSVARAACCAATVCEDGGCPRGWK